MPNPLLLPDHVDRSIDAVKRGFESGRQVRVINLHATPSYRRDEYRRQMELYARHFSPMSLADLDGFFAGTWDKPKPGLIPVVFEGFRDGYDVMLPILEEFGFIGWYFVPSHYPDVPVQEQRAFSKAHSLHPAKTDEYPGERMTMTWPEMAEIAQKHVFACHSHTHNSVMPDTADEVLHEEIVVAKAAMEAKLSKTVDIFAWLYGTETGINPRSDDMLKAAGFRYLYSNFKIQKLL